MRVKSRYAGYPQGFDEPYKINASYPNLIAFGVCRASYVKYTFNVEVRCWVDGEITLSVQHTDVPGELFWVRILRSGLAIQEFNYHRFLHSKGA